MCCGCWKWCINNATAASTHCPKMTTSSFGHWNRMCAGIVLLASALHTFWATTTANYNAIAACAGECLCSCVFSCKIYVCLAAFPALTFTCGYYQCSSPTANGADQKARLILHKWKLKSGKTKNWAKLEQLQLHFGNIFRDMFTASSFQHFCCSSVFFFLLFCGWPHPVTCWPSVCL